MSATTLTKSQIKRENDKIQCRITNLTNKFLFVYQITNSTLFERLTEQLTHNTYDRNKWLYDEILNLYNDVSEMKQELILNYAKNQLNYLLK